MAHESWLDAASSLAVCCGPQHPPPSSPPLNSLANNLTLGAAFTSPQGQRVGASPPYGGEGINRTATLDAQAVGHYREVPGAGSRAERRAPSPVSSKSPRSRVSVRWSATSTAFV